MADPIVTPTPTVPMEPTIPVAGDPVVSTDPIVPDSTVIGTTPTPEPEATFTQAQLDKFIGERLAKEKKAHDDQIKELDSLRKKSEMTAIDKKEWEQKYNQLLEKNMTADELKERELAKAKQEKEEMVANLTTERDHWRDQFQTNLISNSLKDASNEHGAFSAQQIENNLRNFVKVVPMKDQNGEDMDKYHVLVDFPDKDVDGKDIIMSMSPLETVARMKDINHYQNLFKGGNSGVGLSNEDEAGTGTPEYYAQQGAEVYRQAIKDGKVKFK